MTLHELIGQLHVPPGQRPQWLIVTGNTSIRM